MRLTTTEEAYLQKGIEQLALQWAKDEELLAYYDGLQRIEFLGLAVAPQMRKFELCVNWPRVVVDTIEHRQDVRSLFMPGEETASKNLQEGWDANNMDSDLCLSNRDRLILGRSFISVGANEEAGALPIIQVESPREMCVIMDRRRRAVAAAVRVYDYTDGTPRAATIYLPDKTLWCARQKGIWHVQDADEHNLGRVPVVSIINRRRTTTQYGRSEMSDVIPLADAAARTLTNLQVAAEALAVPKRWATGVKPADFMDKGGKILPKWEAYFNAVWATSNKDAKLGQLDAADLKNFTETVQFYGKLAASVTGFPAKYFGLTTTNPPAEGAIRAEESQLVKMVERHNREVGNALGQVMGLYEQIRTGEKVDGSRIAVEWYDPATPTFSQRADALQKLAGGKPLISREGAWDELGFSEARKEREREYLEQEAADDLVGELVSKSGENGGA